MILLGWGLCELGSKRRTEGAREIRVGPYLALPFPSWVVLSSCLCHGTVMSRPPKTWWRLHDLCESIWQSSKCTTLLLLLSAKKYNLKVSIGGWVKTQRTGEQALHARNLSLYPSTTWSPDFTGLLVDWALFLGDGGEESRAGNT